MIAPHPLVRTVIATIACAVTLGSISCRKAKPMTVKEPEPVITRIPSLSANALGSLPGAIYQSQAKSPIHWQPWTKASLDMARDARRLVFCVITMPQQPGFQNALSALEKNPSVVAEINNNYVPILVDGDASRELGILAAILCNEIKRPVQVPLFVWMTHEGNPVAWVPVSSARQDGVDKLFIHNHEIFGKKWEDDLKQSFRGKSLNYTLKDSAKENADRRDRFERTKASRVLSKEPAMDAVRAIRQLASLYDSFSRNLDEAGGLFPAGALELLATASVRPGLPADVRAHCAETTRELLKDVLPSAMFDPLDGGVFIARCGTSWGLPSFVRDCPNQARIAVSLIDAYRATGNPGALESALGVISFAEKNFGTPEQLFAVGVSSEIPSKSWMWTVAEVESVLGAEDAKWWIKATAMRDLGNIPPEMDPLREYFRSNTLGMTMTMAEIAADLGQSSAAFAPRFEAAKAKLLAARNKRFGSRVADESSHAGASFRMVSAYVAAFAATGDAKFRDQAVSLLTRSREAFGVGPKLRMFSKDAPDSIGAGRAFLYALALQAVLDVAAITSDEKWLVWSEDLATTAAEKFTGNEFLRECPEEAKLIDLPISDLTMLFDDSTAGLISATESRLAEIGRPLVLSFSELSTSMPGDAVNRPILFTDIILATVFRHYKVTLLMGADLPPALKTAAERLDPRSIQRRPARPGDQVPAASIKVMFSDGHNLTVSTPETLQQAILPSSGK